MSYEKEEEIRKSLVGKTILDAERDKDGNLILKLSDGEIILVNYSCYGGVLIWKEQNEN